MLDEAGIALTKLLDTFDVHPTTATRRMGNQSSIVPGMFSEDSFAQNLRLAQAARERTHSTGRARDVSFYDDQVEHAQDELDLGAAEHERVDERWWRGAHVVAQRRSSEQSSESVSFAPLSETSVALPALSNMAPYSR